ncbi:hypothetical protein HMSSN036_34680 [Paenibacillus macerans]|nr:hypothetical protein HMSSN036_34680 [Paenibacillus macerans]
MRWRLRRQAETKPFVCYKGTFDLLIVDIRMPGMDGLQLIQEIRSLGFAPHFLILSGYADFEYARKALEFGADGYLLKPVNKEELTAKLQQLSRKLEQERREDWLKNGTLTKEWLVYSLLTGQLREGGDKLREMAEQAGLLWPCYEIVLVGLDVAEPERAEALLHFRTKLASAFKDGGRGIVFGIAPYTVILNNGPLRSESDRKRLYRELRMLAGEWSGQMDAAAGGAVAELQRVGQSYKAAETLLERRFFTRRETCWARIRPGILPESRKPGFAGIGWMKGSWRSACFISRMSAMPEPWSRCWRQPCGSGWPREPGRRRSSKSCFRRRTR